MTIQGLIQPTQSRHSCRNSSGKFSVTLHAVQIPLPVITPCWSSEKGSEKQTIHVGRRCQAVREELVHNAAPGILRDSHSPPFVAVGQVPQQPGPILLTYRYWFLFLGLRIVSFLTPLIYLVISEFTKKRHPSRRILYFP